MVILAKSRSHCASLVVVLVQVRVWVILSWSRGTLDVSIAFSGLPKTVPRACRVRPFVISILPGAWHILFLEEILSLAGTYFGTNVPALGEVVTAGSGLVCLLPSLLILASDGDAWVWSRNSRRIVVPRTRGEGVCAHAPTIESTAHADLGAIMSAWDFVT